MEIKSPTFIGSYVREDQCPKIQMPEYAFIGRSNVGKSSLINMLCQKKDLAKVSGTPGKTQTINYFDVDNQWLMVDLPGYGYARISRSKREQWEKMIHYFLKNRKNLQYVFLLIDSMIPPQKIDIDFMNWLGENRVPFVIAYTKSDRILPIDLKKTVGKKAKPYLVVAEMEALILADIDIVNTHYGTNLSKHRNPMLITDPKVKLIKETQKINFKN